MDTRLLKIFLAVAKEGTLKAAGRELHLTSSALSHGLKDLETELGTRLFDRAAGRLVLNQAGDQLLRDVEAPLAQLERAAHSIKTLGKWGHGRLRIGSPASIGQHVLPAVARELHRAFPKLLVTIECGESRRLIELLHEHQIDLALAIEPEPAPFYDSRELFEDELLFAFSREHAWAELRSLSPGDVKQQPLLSYGRNTATAQLIRGFFHQQEIEPQTLMEIAHVATMVELVKRQVAVAILAPWLFDFELRNGSVKMRPLGSKPLRRRWAIVHRTSSRLGWPEEEFIRLCRQQVAKMRLDRNDLPASARVSSR